MMLQRLRPIIAIDGPAGSGKSTVAKLVAKELGLVHLNTGAIYRGVALKVIELGIDANDSEGVSKVARNLMIHFETLEDGATRLLLDDEDCSEKLYVPSVAKLASVVSSYKGVRDALLGIQRNLGKQGGVVLEGRDIGTVVFPDAEVKVFLTASAEVRAKRRFDELILKGENAELGKILESIRARDERDRTRKIAPLTPAVDAVHLDTSEMDIDSVVEKVVQIAQGLGSSFDT